MILETVFLLFLRTPPDFPEFALPEDLCRKAALAVRDKCHWAIGLFREVASGKDLKKFLYVCKFSFPPFILFIHFLEMVGYSILQLQL